MTSEWSINTLKSLLDEREQHARELRAADNKRFDDLREADQRALDVKREADQKALQVALQTQKEQRDEDKQANDHRFETGNNQRGQAADERHGYMTIAAFEQYQRNQSTDRFAGKTDIRGTVTLILGIAALAISAFLNFGPL